MLYKGLGKWQGKGQEKIISEVPRSSVYFSGDRQIRSNHNLFVSHWHTVGINAYRRFVKLQKISKTCAQRCYQYFWDIMDFADSLRQVHWLYLNICLFLPVREFNSLTNFIWTDFLLWSSYPVCIQTILKQTSEKRTLIFLLPWLLSDCRKQVCY